MYSHYYAEAVRDVTKALSVAQMPTVKDVERILARAAEGPLNLNDAATLLRLCDAPSNEPALQLIRTAVTSRFRHSRSTVHEIAPVYLSNDCRDRCKYCHFAEQHKDTIRIKLSRIEIAREVRNVARDGSLVIEFTLATDADFTPERLADAIRIAMRQVGCRAGAGVMLCSDHQTEETYRHLADCGLRAMVQWDETLDAHEYAKWHGDSPRKSLFTERIDNHDRAMRAGLQVATGALFGLADVGFETLMQVLKARYLRRTYNQAPFTFGTARLKATGVNDRPPARRASDDAYDLALLVYKLCEPDLGRWLQTREEFEANLDRMLDGDCFTYRCGRVTPGGHLVHKNETQKLAGQFRVQELTRSKFERGLAKANFRVDYAWMR
jgi:2-iminoacetate synthase